MKDSFGRTIDYLRVSVTDRCNLRCVYCMPEEGVEDIPHSQILTFDEIHTLCALLARHGLTKIKITGGEPLVRRGVPELIAQLKTIPGISSVTITTNGVLLETFYRPLVEAGVDCITVSLDTLDPRKYRALTRRDELEAVLQGIRLAQEENLVRLKVNAVPTAPLDGEDIAGLAQFARDHDTDVRFIEVMPIGLGSQFQTVDEAQVRRLLEERFGPLTPCLEKRGNGPAVCWSLEGFLGKIGFISAVSHKFCDSCNRVRLTADGHLKTCLQYEAGAMLRPYLRAGDEAGLLAAVERAIQAKPKGHRFEAQEGFAHREQHKMSQIGG